MSHQQLRLLAGHTSQHQSEKQYINQSLHHIIYPSVRKNGHFTDVPYHFPMPVRKNGHFTDEPYHFAMFVQKTAHFLDKVRWVLQEITKTCSTRGDFDANHMVLASGTTKIRRFV